MKPITGQFRISFRDGAYYEVAPAEIAQGMAIALQDCVWHLRCERQSIGETAKQNPHVATIDKLLSKAEAALSDAGWL